MSFYIKNETETADCKQKYKHYTAERMTSSISRKRQLNRSDYLSQN